MNTNPPCFQENDTKEFYIKKGSLCFVVPFQIKGSKVFEEYFSSIEKSYSSEADNKLLDIKEKLVTEIKKEFKNASSSVPKAECCLDAEEYKGKYLCRCWQDALEFHDDISQIDQFTQIYLDTYNVSCQSAQNLNISFSFKLLMFINNNKHGECGMLFFEINTKDIRCNLCNRIENSDNNISIDSILFIKHLFYKKKLEVNIITKTGKLDESPSLEIFANEQIKKIGKLKYKKKCNPHFDIMKNTPYEYSFIELNELTSNTHSTEPLVLDFSHIDYVFDNYASALYGLLLSDEGWRNTPKDLSKARLKDHWTTRNYSCVFFLSSNALLINQRHLYPYQNHKYYNNSVYTNYEKLNSCFTGIYTISIFVFTRAIMNVVLLKNSINTCNDKASFWRIFRSKKNDRTKKELAKIYHLLNSKSMNLSEMNMVQKCIYTQLNVHQIADHLFNIYKLKIENLNFKYNKRNSVIILILTIIFGVGATIFGALAAFDIYYK